MQDTNQTPAPEAWSASETTADGLTRPLPSAPLPEPRRRRPLAAAGHWLIGLLLDGFAAMARAEYPSFADPRDLIDYHREAQERLFGEHQRYW
jgi:hypothetical protein